ncbi:MAG: hypothetical protein E6772_12320 [Dysgonomonas sp.]|nr:hypothetical protein [Dysgonomonas sp.]
MAIEEFKYEKIRLKRGQFLLYELDGIDIDYIIKKHKEYSYLTDEERDIYKKYTKAGYKAFQNSAEINELLSLHGIINTNSKTALDFKLNEIERKMKLKPIGKQQKTKLHHKFTYLIHLLCSRCTHNEDGCTKINAGILKQIIGDEYNLLLDTLLRLNIIWTLGDYVIGKTSRTYYLNENQINSIKTSLSSNYTVRKYIDEADKIHEKHKKFKFKGLSERNELIVNRYNKCLMQLNMTHTDECRNFIFKEKEYVNDKPIQKEYYKNIFEKYLLKERLFQIKQIDKNNRIYHVLTSTPRELKKFLNIKFSIDIKNSHPLLLNKLLLIYYTDNKLFNDIINTNIDINEILNYNNIPYIYQASDNPHNNLTNKILHQENQLLFHIPSDVKDYIYKTSDGVMWNELLDRCEKEGLTAIDRNELKAKMFAEVFYSKDKRTSYKEYGKIFKSIYPNVFKIINELKPKGAETKLSNLIMKIESELFHQILYRIYNETTYDVVTIHDAVVILNTPNNENCLVQDIKPIMEEVYNNYGLFPSFSIDEY